MKCCKVQFKHLGKRYYFGCDKIKLQNGDKVIVQTIRGTELGEVVWKSIWTYKRWSSRWN